MAHDAINDRRRALRVQLRSYTNVVTADGRCAAHLLNISESGALIAIIEPHQMAAGEAISLHIELPDGSSACMEGHVAHVKGHMLGLDCGPATDEDAARIEAVIDQYSKDIK